MMREGVLSMKIDNFVRGCLLAIVVLLALLVFRPSVHVIAAPPTQWLVIYGGNGNDVATIQSELNAQQAQGFQYVGSHMNSLIFKK